MANRTTKTEMPSQKPNNITVITGPATSYYHFLQPMTRALQTGKADFLAIVPVNRAVRRLKRLLIDRSPKQALADPPVFTFDALLLELYRASPGAKRLISGEIFLVLIKDILSKHAAEFSYFMPEGQLSDGLVQKVAATVSELRNFGYDSREFLKIEVEDRQAHPQKYRAFGRILTLLESHFGSRFIDEPFARAEAARTLNEELFRRRFPHANKIYISGYGLFSPPMLTFIERVARWSEVFVKLDYLPQNEALFAHTKEALQRLKKLGANVQPSVARKSELALRLFNREQNWHETIDLSRRLLLSALTDRRLEVAFIAGQIRTLHQKGIPLHRMAVTFSHLEKYVPLLRRVFADYGIPFNLSTGFEVAKAPLIATFLGLFRLIAENFPMEKTFALLNSPLVKTPPDLQTDVLRRLCIKTRLRHLNAPGLQHLENLLKKAPYPLALQESGIDVQQALRQIERLRETLQALYGFPRRGTAVKLRTRFLELLNHYDLVRWYKLDYRHLSERQKESSFRAYNRFVKIFERTVWTLQIIYGSEPIEVTVLFDALEAALKKELYNLSEWQDYGVQIMPRLEILAVDAQILFVGGLIDGDFPRSSVKDIFFGDNVRTVMGLVASEELLAQDRFLFYELLDSPAEQVYLTYPQYRDEEALVPSSFLADLREAAHITLFQVDDEASLFENRQKLWERFGRHIFFLTGEESLHSAQKQADLLFAITAKPRKTLEDLLYRIQFASLRLMGRQFTRFEGNLTRNTHIVAELKERYANRVWSVSQLETYGFCPMQFFFKYILKVQPTEEIEEEMTPLERGALIHTILFRFYSELRDKGVSRRPADFRQRLLEIAREEFNRLPYEGLFWELEKLRYFGNEHVRGIFDVFLEQEQERLDKLQAEPAFFEWSFGYSGDFPADPASQVQPVTLQHDDDRLRLQGRIDRVDRLPDDGAMIIDYKTGTVHARTKDILLGTHFQLPLYLFVLPQLKAPLLPVYGGLYQLKSADKCVLKPLLADGQNEILQRLNSRSQALLPNRNITDDDQQPLTFDDLLEHSVALAFEKINALRTGQFQHTDFPDDERCSAYCDYRRICQKITAKLKNKTKTAEETEEAQEIPEPIEDYGARFADEEQTNPED